MCGGGGLSNNIGSKDFLLFPRLSKIILQEINVNVHCKHLENITVDMQLQFKDIEDLHNCG